MALNLVKRIRSGRKMFKLLKFIDEYKEFVYEASDFKVSELMGSLKSLVKREKNSSGIIVLSNFFQLVNKLSSVFYYLIDNAVWFFNVGLVSKKVVTKSTWKRWKDIFNLLRNWT